MFLHQQHEPCIGLLFCLSKLLWFITGTVRYSINGSLSSSVLLAYILFTMPVQCLCLSIQSCLGCNSNIHNTFSKITTNCHHLETTCHIFLPVPLLLVKVTFWGQMSNHELVDFFCQCLQLLLPTFESREIEADKRF